MKEKSPAVIGRVVRPRFIPVREPGTNWLLFMYDPERKLIEVQRRGRKTLVDLGELDLTPRPPLLRGEEKEGA